jgi:hypothetical protein
MASHNLKIQNNVGSPGFQNVTIDRDLTIPDEAIVNPGILDISIGKIYSKDFDIDLWFEQLLQGVRLTLQGENGEENLLGTLEFSLNSATTIPAIYRKNKEITLNKWKMHPNSGILCVLHDAIQFKVDPIINGNMITMGFLIELIQYNKLKNTLAATYRLVNSGFLDVYDSPITTPLTELGDTVALERTIIKTVVCRRSEIKKLNL